MYTYRERDNIFTYIYIYGERERERERERDLHNVLPYSPLLKKACVRQVVLDKWFPLIN